MNWGVQRNGNGGRPIRKGLAWALIVGVLGSAVTGFAEEGDGFSQSIKKGFSNLAKPFSPQPSDQSEPIDKSLSIHAKAKPSSGLYVSVARLYEQAGKLDEAEKQYQAALKEKSDDLAALLGYAQLKDRMRKPDEALKLYQQAAKAHPDEASVYNNMGLFHARRGKLDEAEQSIGRAILLEPKNALYRNNIATVLVDMGKPKDAFGHMRAVHGESAAYYNLGYLFAKRGQNDEAVRHFRAALQYDPAMAQAQTWISRLTSPSPSPVQRQQLAGDGGAAPARPQIGPTTATPPTVPSASRRLATSSGPQGPVSVRPATDASQVHVSTSRGQGGMAPAPLPPDVHVPTRLPPTTERASTAGPAPSAPLPPPYSASHGAAQQYR
ncbi:MAG: tetratricopeptide repeat protein [Planctomycetota bacterium]